MVQLNFYIINTEAYNVSIFLKIPPQRKQPYVIVIIVGFTIEKAH